MSAGSCGATRGIAEREAHLEQLDDIFVHFLAEEFKVNGRFRLVDLPVIVVIKEHLCVAVRALCERSLQPPQVSGAEEAGKAGGAKQAVGLPR